jgi:cobalt-zinc-cadmium efflux system membrane fusion protein
MSFTIRKVLAWIVRQVPTVLTLAALAGVAVYGAHTGWRIPPFAELSGQGADPAKKSTEPPVRIVSDASASSEVKSPSHHLKRIEFPSADAVSKAGIAVAKVEERPLDHYVTANGAVDYEPSRYAQLASRASGSVWSVHKEIGDHIRKGDVLALIEAAEVGQAKADFLQSLTQVDVRKMKLERLRAVGGSTVPDISLREAEAALRESRISLFNAQQRLLNLGLVVRLRDVEKLSEDQLARHLRLLGLPEDVRNDVDPETITANLLPLTAPFDGAVVDRIAAPGVVVNTGHPQTLFVVADTRRLHIDLEVHLEDIPFIRVGQPVTFEADGGRGETAQASVSHISPEVNEKTRNVVVHAEFDNAKRRLRPHAFGTGTILIKRPQTIVVPDAAIQADGSTHLVFVGLSATSFQVRHVQLGLRGGGFTEVRGVHPGETVVTTGSHMLKSELLKERIAGDD